MVSPPLQVGSPPTQTWFRRNWKRLLLVIVGVPALAAAIAGGYLYAQGQKLIQSPAYQTVLTAVQKSALVQDKIGQPINNASWLPIGELSDSKARFDFEVEGPKGKALIQTQLGKENDQWGPSALGFKLPDELRYTSLMKEYNFNNPSDLPKFDPNAKPLDKPVINLPPPDEELNIEIDVPLEHKK